MTDLALGVRAAAAGLGIVRAPLPIVLGYLKEEQLVDVLREWTPPGVEVQAVLPPGGAIVPKTRAFVDALQETVARDSRVVAAGRRRR